VPPRGTVKDENVGQDGILPYIDGCLRSSDYVESQFSRRKEGEWAHLTLHRA
jgi:hypothetical protein